MKVYYLYRPVTLRTARQTRQCKAARERDRPVLSEIHVAAQNELSLLRQALALTYPGEPLESLVSMPGPASLKGIPGLPMQLGMREAHEAGELREDCHPLVDQLRGLRERHPDRRLFRILLINAFGTNLGDNMIGLTAFRQVLPVLRAALPEVAVDVLLGWHKNDSLARQFRGVEGIDRILHQGPTLAGLMGYQGVFDTSGLVGLPRYGRMPMVDWYLWWMGLDPQGIPPHRKGNVVFIPEGDRQEVRGLLSPASGPRILINPAASVPLRSMPESATRRLLETLLVVWPEVQVILVQPLSFDHPRVVDLSAAINTTDRLAALMVEVDGLIGVDTYTIHLADGTATPAVTLEVSMPPDLCPYYPLADAVLLPGAEALPAWNRPKVPAERWAGMAEAYEAAWATLDFPDVIDRLRRCMDKKTAAPGVFLPRLLSDGMAQDDVAEQEAPAWLRPGRCRQDDRADALGQQIVRVAEQVLCAGDTVVYVAPGAGEPALALARCVGPHGRLVAIEPRRHLHQLLCANLVRGGIWHGEIHHALPEGDGIGRREISGLQVQDEYHPLAMGNHAEPESVLCWPLDALALSECRFLVISSPLARVPVLQGARDTLARLRPVVLVGLVSMQEVQAFGACFANLDYRVRAMPIRPGGADDERHGFLLAEPRVSEES